MSKQMSQALDDAARRRVDQTMGQIRHTMAMTQRGAPLAAEPDQTRQLSYIQSKANLNRDEALTFRRGLMASVEPQAEVVAGPEVVRGTIDFVGVSFLEQGMIAARSVARVATRGGQGFGSGFMISPRLFLTNNHVLEDPDFASRCVAEFEYERDIFNNMRRPSRFAFDPASCFLTDHIDDLDYTIVAIGRRVEGPNNIDRFGFSPLSAAGNKHQLGIVANIVQHPDGRYKEVVLRENRIAARTDHVLHYVSDTEPGSSGSPVFNNQWQAIALHHWGGPHRSVYDDSGRPLNRHVNEGIRISAIVAEAEERRDELTPLGRRLLDEALHLGEARQGAPTETTPETPTAFQDSVRLTEDGTAVWRLPVELAIRVPALSAATKNDDGTGGTLPPSPPTDEGSERIRRRIDRDYDNRRGYNPKFIPGERVDMPDLSSELEQIAARIRDVEAGENPYELRYQHFSVVMNARRRLAFFTACNIDGKNSKNIDRRTGRISRAERLEVDSMPEGREKWYDDPRIDDSDETNDELYKNQVLPGGTYNRMNRMFHRGHLVRRLDPVWGAERRARRAEADTFHFTNCTPQAGFFNARESLWLGIENHVLDNARADDERVSVFAGCVFRDNDPRYRDDLFPEFKVPLRYWKVAVWSDEGDIRSLALLAHQYRVRYDMPEALPTNDAGGDGGEERLDDTEDVEEFLSSISEIESLTGLRFPDNVRRGDVNEGADTESLEKRKRIHDISELPLKPQRRVNRKSRTRSKRNQ